MGGVGSFLLRLSGHRGLFPVFPTGMEHGHGMGIRLPVFRVVIASTSATASMLTQTWTRRPESFRFHALFYLQHPTTGTSRTSIKLRVA